MVLLEELLHQVHVCGPIRTAVTSGALVWPHQRSCYIRCTCVAPSEELLQLNGLTQVDCYAKYEHILILDIFNVLRYPLKNSGDQVKFLKK